MSLNVEDLRLVRSLIENFPMGVYESTPAGQILVANLAMVEMLGYPDAATLCATEAEELYDNAEDRRRWMAELEKSGSVRNYEVRWRKRDGTVLWVKNTATAVRGENGVFQYFGGIVESFMPQSLTPEKNDLQLGTLREHDTVYLQMLDTLPLCAVRKDRNHVITHANQHYKRRTGVGEHTSIIGLTDFDIHPQDLAELYQKSDNEVFETGEIYQAIEQHAERNGYRRKVHVIKVPVYDAAGKVSGVQCLFWDQTDSTLLAVHQSSMQAARTADFQRLFEDTYDVVYRHDMKGYFTELNKAGQELLGYPEEEIAVLNIEEIVAPEYLPEIRKQTDRKLLPDSPVAFTTYEVDVITSDRRRVPIELKSQVIFEKERPVAVEGHCRNISARREVEEARTKEIHHRVKNNLEVVLNLLEGEARQTDHAVVRDTLRRCSNRVLTMSIIHRELYESQDLASINLDHYVRSLTAKLAGLNKRPGLKITFRFSIEKHIQLGLDTIVPIGLIINELVTNALTHAFPLKPKEERHGEVRIGMHLEQDGFYLLTVSDNGAGVPREFDPRTAKSLGLRLVYGLAEEQMEGKIELARSRGTMYSIRLKAI